MYLGLLCNKGFSENSYGLSWPKSGPMGRNSRGILKIRKENSDNNWLLMMRMGPTDEKEPVPYEWKWGGGGERNYKTG